MIKTLLLVLIAFTPFFSAYAQKGTIKGTVKDKSSGEEIIGANVLLEGTTTGATTDVFGKFEFQADAGSYILVFSFVGYKKLTKSIEVVAGQEIEINAELDPDTEELEAVEVVGKADVGAEAVVTKTMQESKVVVNVIGAMEISKISASNAADVMRRISGVTLIDNRFVVVRGLAQRYNSVSINGIMAPSTEPNEKVFSFDILPSSMIDQLRVFKAGSSALQGEFAGAIVNVITKNAVDENFNQFQFGLGFRFGTTFKDFKVDNYGNTGDLFGFGAKGREWEGLPDEPIKKSDPLSAEYARGLDDNWGSTTKKALPGLGLAYNMGRYFDVGKGSGQISTLNSIRYSNTNKTTTSENNRYINYQPDGTSSVDKANDDIKYANTVQMGFMSNWSYQINSDHVIDFKNMYSRIGDREFLDRFQLDIQNDFERDNVSMRTLNRGIYLGSLGGRHDFNQDKTVFSWGAGYAYVNRNEPDWKRSISQRALGSDNRFIVQSNITNPEVGGRFSSYLDESTISGRLDFSHDLGKQEDKEGLVLKIGGYTNKADRDFAARWLSMTQSDPLRNATDDEATRLKNLPLDSIFLKENIAPDKFVIDEGTNSKDKYQAENQLMAGYFNFAFPVKRFDLEAGVRVENFKQELTTVLLEGNDPEKVVDVDETNTLPSVNLTYNLSDQAMFRLAYSKSVNRPAFREIAPFSFYDFEWRADIIGNSDLQTATINNVDLKWETYPRPGETVSVGVFYKNFENPIERNYIPGASNPVFIFQNADKAVDYGIELEFKKTLDFISDKPFYRNLSTSINLAYIFSEVDLPNGVNRALQGQSPYVVNAGFYYDNNEGVRVNLLYNVIGPRIYSVGDTRETFNWYDMPRHLVDINASKDISEKVTLQLTIANLLNYPYRIREDANNDGKITDDNIDRIIYKAKEGQNLTLQLTYNF